ncbi:MAG: flagellar basal body-associated protein FliL [Vicinamibacterales bacterium]|jgi:flagellar FliL protein
MSETAEAAPAKGGSKKMLIVGAIVLAIAAGGGFWWTQAAGHAEEAEGKPKRKAHASQGLIKLDPFVVNLADGAGTRFLRTTLQLVIEPAEAVEEVSKNDVKMLQLRSKLLELLAEQQASSLVTPEGKAAMKAALISRAQEVLEDWEIADVLFAEFVVQF